jgi:hypothetical protein
MSIQEMEGWQMTIQEAIKSGRPFRRKADGVAWISSILGTFITSWRYLSSDQKVRLTTDDILADDWEIKE